MRLQEVTAGESDRRPLLLQTAMGAAAHTGPAGRYDAWRHEASMHAFVIDMLTPEDRPACSALTRRSAAGDGQLR